MHAEDRIVLPTGAAMAGLTGFGYGYSCIPSSHESFLRSPFFVGIVLFASAIWGARLHENSDNTQITPRDLNARIFKNLVCASACLVLAQGLRSLSEKNDCSNDDTLGCPFVADSFILTTTLTALFVYTVLMNIMFRIDRSVE